MASRRNLRRYRRVAELRYSGQAFELAVPIAPGTPDTAAMTAAFDAEHERTYGHASPGDPTDLVSLKVLARSSAYADAAVLSRIVEQRRPGGAITRTAYFGAAAGQCETAVLGREAVGRTGRAGPLIIEGHDATIVVPPRCTARLDEDGNIDIRITADD